MVLFSSPPAWSSVHRPIPFVYNYETRTVIIDNSEPFGGFLRINFDVSFATVPVVGDKIIIEDVGTTILEYLEGIHTVTEVISPVEIVTDKDVGVHVFSLDNVTAKLLQIPEIKLYSGYATDEEYPDDLPLTLVATFTPENSPDNDIRFDVSEYLKSIFRIIAPVEGIDFNMFNRFRLFFDGYYQETYQVLNSSIETDLLMSDYANTGNPLNSKFPPIVFGCGRTIISFLENNVVTNVVSINDDIMDVEGDYYVGDYSSSDYYTN